MCPYPWSSPYSVDAAYRTAWADEAVTAVTERLDDVQLEAFTDGARDPGDLLRLPDAIRRLTVPLRLTLERVLRMPQVRSEQAKVQCTPGDVPPAKDDGAPPGMSLSLQGLPVSFSWDHPTYFVSQDRQAGRTEQAPRDPGRRRPFRGRRA